MWYLEVTPAPQVAVKLESVKARHPQLLYESKLYKILQVTRSQSGVASGGKEGRYMPGKEMGLCVLAIKSVVCFQVDGFQRQGSTFIFLDCRTPCFYKSKKSISFGLF